MFCWGPNLNTVAWSSPWMRNVFDQFGDAAFASVMAHEYGHGAMSWLGFTGKGNFRYQIYREGFADCMAGAWLYWMSYYRYTDNIGVGDRSELYNLMFNLGSSNAQTTRDNHGDAAWRTSLSTYGFNNGFQRLHQLGPSARRILNLRGVRSARAGAIFDSAGAICPRHSGSRLCSSLTVTRWSMERMPLIRALGPLALALTLLALPSVASAQTAPTLSDTWDGAATAEPNVRYVHPDTSGFTAAGEPHSAGNGTCHAGAGTGGGHQHGRHLLAEGGRHRGPDHADHRRLGLRHGRGRLQAEPDAPAAANALFCNDDNRGNDVELTFTSQAGATYYTQWGGCAGCAGGSSGPMDFAILTNDSA